MADLYVCSHGNTKPCDECAEFAGMQPTTPLANVERSPLPAQESDFFESRIRNQAGNIIYDVFGAQNIRYKPERLIVQQLSKLQDLITTALLAAHNSTRSSDASNEPDRLRGTIRELRGVILGWQRHNIRVAKILGCFADDETVETTVVSLRADASREYVRGLSDALVAVHKHNTKYPDNYRHCLYNCIPAEIQALISQHSPEVKINDDQG